MEQINAGFKNLQGGKEIGIFQLSWILKFLNVSECLFYRPVFVFMCSHTNNSDLQNACKR